jgi:hypothetical protein
LIALGALAEQSIGINPYAELRSFQMMVDDGHERGQ